jgi:hypothetical protein
MIAENGEGDRKRPEAALLGCSGIEKLDVPHDWRELL